MKEETEPIVNVGVIGLGVFMARQHLPNMTRNPRIHIRAICDVDQNILQQRARELSPEIASTDPKAVLGDPEVQLVLVGTRSSMHAHFIEQAAAHGKDVFVEKPMTMTYEETDRVLAAVRDAGIHVSVGFNRRFAPIMVEARRLFNGFRSGPANVVYRIVDDHRIRPPYIFDLHDGGGHLLQEGCHIFDLLAWYLGEEPVEVFAAGPLETDNAVILKFAGGSVATLLCGGKGGLFYPKELMEVFCNSTTLAVDQFYELRMEGQGGSLRQTFPLDVKTESEIKGNSMSAFYEASFAQRPEQELEGAHAANVYHKIKVDKGHTQEMTALADALTAGRPFEVGTVDGARATVCALKAYESIRANRPIAIRPDEYGLQTTAAAISAP